MYFYNAFKVLKFRNISKKDIIYTSSELIFSTTYTRQQHSLKYSLSCAHVCVCTRNISFFKYCAKAQHTNLLDYLFNNIPDFLPCLVLKVLWSTAVNCTTFSRKNKPLFHTISFALNWSSGSRTCLYDVCVFNANKNQWALHSRCTNIKTKLFLFSH